MKTLFIFIGALTASVNTFAADENWNAPEAKTQDIILAHQKDDTAQIDGSRQIHVVVLEGRERTIVQVTAEDGKTTNYRVENCRGWVEDSNFLSCIARSINGEFIAYTYSKHYVRTDLADIGPCLEGDKGSFTYMESSQYARRDSTYSEILNSEDGKLPSCPSPVNGGDGYGG
jgi:hypothetical protein